MYTDQEIIDIQVKRINELTIMYLELKARYDELMKKVVIQKEEKNG